MFSRGDNIMVVDAAGTQIRMLIDAVPRSAPNYGFHADISPDGRQIVFSACNYPWELQFLNAKRSNALLTLPVSTPDGYDVALISIDGGEPIRLTDNPFLDHFPAWSPDGTRIAFIASFDKGRNTPTGKALYTMAADGSDIQEIGSTHYRAVAAAPLVWSPDGEWLAFLMNEGGFGQGRVLKKNLYKVRPNGRELRLLAEDVVSAASWSPDGQRLAVAKYVGDDVGLFTLAADGSEQKLIANIINGVAFDIEYGPHQYYIRTVSWSPDGTQILFSCGYGACLVELDDKKMISLVREIRDRNHVPYVAAWSPDGTRIALFGAGIPEFPYPRGYSVLPLLITVSRDGTDRRDLIRVDADGNLVPANSPQ